MILDNLRIALHHLSCNKNRTIYTTVISFILGFLLLFLAIIDISIRVDGDKLSQDMYYEKMNDIYFDNNIDCNLLVQNTNLNISVFLDKNDAEKVIDEINNGNIYVDYYSINLTYINGSFEFNENHYNSVKCIDIDKYNFKLVNNNKTDKTKYLFVSDKFSKENNLNAGDVIKFKSDKTGNIFELEVVDIFISSEKEYDDLLFDISAINNNMFGITSFNIQINKNNNVKDTIKFNSNLVDNYKSMNEDYYYGCNNYSMYLKIQIFTNIFFYIVLVFLVIVMLLSIGIISNSILVLLDLNKSKIGLLRVIGIRNKDLLLILLFEIIMTVLFGLILSIILIYSFSFVLKNINMNIFNILYSFLDQKILLKYDVYLINDFYISILLISFLLLILILFLYKRIKNVIRINPVLLLRRDE